MLVSAAAALLLAVGLQPPADRSHAEALARAGQTETALRLFAQIVRDAPGDIEARLWVARLALRLGRTGEAEAGFLSVLGERPQDVDARIGLGAVLTRRGEWQQALVVLHEAEPAAGTNPDLLSALARAYRRGGNLDRALHYFARARELAPDDPDVVLGYEAVTRLYGHSLVVDGFAERGLPDAAAASASLAAHARVAAPLHVEATIRVQRRQVTSEVIAGGGFVWRVAPTAVVAWRAAGGRGNVSLPALDLSADVVRYVGPVELGGGIRRMLFAGADVAAASPTLSFDPGGRWRLDARYTYSRTRFDHSGEIRGDHSFLFRETWRGWRRVSLNAAGAYGIDSFENLTADGIASLAITTATAGVQIRLPSLTAVAAAWEHQWRSNDTAVDRVTVTFVQAWR